MTAPSTDPFWRAVVERLGTMPMPCPFAIKDLAAAKGVDPEQVFFRFWTHYCNDAPCTLQ